MWKEIRHFFGFYTAEEKEAHRQWHIRENARLAAEARARRIREEAAAKVQRQREREEARREKLREAKARKEKQLKILKARAFVKEKGLRKVRRDGRTVFVNQDGNIVNYLILGYLLFGGNDNHSSSDYSHSHSSSSDDSSSWSSSDSSWSSGGSDFGGSFGGGDSGGGGASGDF